MKNKTKQNNHNIPRIKLEETKDNEKNRQKKHKLQRNN